MEYRMGLGSTNRHENPPRDCHSERSEESASYVLFQSRFLVATLLGMTGWLDDFRGSGSITNDRCEPKGQSLGCSRSTAAARTDAQACGSVVLQT
jgi:hypothetical protein